MWSAAEAGVGGDALILAVWAFLGIVVTTLGTIAVQAVKSRSERTSGPPASNGNGNGSALIQVATVQGALVQRADDNDERFEVFDRARAADREDLDDVLGFLDRSDPDWRQR